MKISDLSLREKVLQTVVIRMNKEKFVSDNVGAVIFYGEIIAEADEMGLDGAREIATKYIKIAKIRFC